MKSAGKSAHTNCPPKGDEQMGVGDVFRYVLVNRDLGIPALFCVCWGEGWTSFCWGYQLCDLGDGAWGPLGIETFRSPAL